MTIPTDEAKKLTICLYLSGERAQKAFTVLEALSTTPGFGTRWDVIIGIDSISYDLAHFTHSEHRSGSKAIFIESRGCIGKDQFIFAMVANLQTQYILILDDAVSLEKGWISQVEAFIDATKPRGLAGALLQSTATPSSPSSTQPIVLHESAVLINTAFLRTYEHAAIPTILDHDFAFFDEHLSTALGLSAAPAHPFNPQILQLSRGLRPREQSLDDAKPLLSACLCTYGDHPELILRCLDSILREHLSSSDIEILLGCNVASLRVMREIEERYNRGLLNTLIRSPKNLNKSGIQRLTFRLSRGAYILSLDDDMYFKAGWLERMKKFVVARHPFDAAGRLHSLSSRLGWSGRKKPYHEFVARKKWWRGKQPHDDEVHFPAGQCFLARRSFAIANDYPDLGMKIDWDDVLLGDLVIQLDGTQIFFSDDLYERIVVDDIQSRGHHGGG